MLRNLKSVVVSALAGVVLLSGPALADELTDRIRDTAFQMDMDQKIDKKLN